MSPRDTYLNQQDAGPTSTATISASVRDALALIVAELSDRPPDHSPARRPF